MIIRLKNQKKSKLILWNFGDNMGHLKIKFIKDFQDYKKMNR